MVMILHGAGLVDQVDHRRERGGLARAGGAGDQREPALGQGDVADDGGEVELVDGGDAALDDAHDDAGGAQVAVGRAAEAGDAGDRRRRSPMPATRRSSKLSAKRAGAMEVMKLRTCSSVSGAGWTCRRMPPMRMLAGTPAWMWMSDALCSTAKRRSGWKSIFFPGARR